MSNLNKEFWRKYFKEYDLLNSLIPYQELLEELIRALNIEKRDQILDAGSGTGNLSLRMQKKGAKVVGFDFSEEGVEIHKKKSPEAETYIGDLTKGLPFEDGYFDKLVSNNTLYAIPKDKRDRVVKEFYRVLKPEGKIVISNITVNFKPFNIYKDHIKKLKKRNGFWKTLGNVIKFIIPTIKIFYYNSNIRKEHATGSCNFFEKGEQKDLLTKNNFKVTKSERIVYAGQAELVEGEK